jgi:hypothetical protein
MDNPSDINPNKLIIVERPTGLWFFGSVFAGFGFVLMFVADAPRLMGAIFALIGAFMLVMTPSSTVTLDRSAGTFVLHSRSLVVQRAEALPLVDLVGIELQSGSGVRGRGAYRIVFAFRERGEVPMTGYFAGGRVRKQKQVDQMRTFLHMTLDR